MADANGSRPYKKRSSFDDLTGRRFGRLVVDGEAPRVGTLTAWYCTCDCGEKKVVLGGNLRSITRGTKSCGCLNQEKCSGRRPPSPKVEDLTGKTFGYLRVVGRLPRKKGSRASWWHCECLICGRPTTATGTALRHGHKGSCGCAKDSGITVRSEKSRNMFRRYFYIRRREDPVYAIESRMRARLRAHMKTLGISKSRRTEAALGYTMCQLKERLTETLPPGTTWADLVDGKLEIDHIVGLENFHYTNEDDLAFREAWALSNLQLLKLEDHRIKSAAARRGKPRRRFRPA